MGVAKINVNTECQLVFADATREYIEAGKDREGKGYDPRKLLKPGYESNYCQSKREDGINSVQLEKLKVTVHGSGMRINCAFRKNMIQE